MDVPLSTDLDRSQVGAMLVAAGLASAGLTR